MLELNKTASSPTLTPGETRLKDLRIDERSKMEVIVMLDVKEGSASMLIFGWTRLQYSSIICNCSGSHHRPDRYGMGQGTNSNFQFSIFNCLCLGVLGAE